MAPLSLLGTNPCTVGIEEVRKKAAFFPSVTQFIRSGILFNSRLQVYNFHLATSCFIVLHRCFILCELCRSRFDLQKYSHFTKHLDKWYCQQMQQRNGWGDSPCAAHILFKDSLVPLSHCRSWAVSVTVVPGSGHWGEQGFPGRCNVCLYLCPWALSTDRHCCSIPFLPAEKSAQRNPPTRTKLLHRKVNRKRLGEQLIKGHASAH